MRFTVAAAVLASSAMASTAVSTDYTTQLITVTACPSTVTNCPASAKTTSVSTSYVPLTTSIVYTTKVHTITSCGPEVTNCPAHSTVIKTETIPVSTTICPVTATATPSGPGHYGNSTMPAGPSSTGPAGGVSTVPVGGKPSTSAAPPPPATTPVAPVCPGSTVTAITKSYTTVLTSVEYSTIAVPCPTGGASKPPSSAGLPPPPTVSTPACSGANCTSPGKPPVAANGAGSLAGSAILAAVAGVAAYVLA